MKFDLRLLLVAALLGSIGLGNGAFAAETITLRSVHIQLIQQVEVPARHQGLLQEIVANEGTQVKAGDLLARTDDEEARLEHARAQTELAIAMQKAKSDEDLRTAEQQHDVAVRNLERATESMKKFAGSISAAEYDQFRLEANVAKNSVAKAKHELDLAKLNVKVVESSARLAEAKLARHHLKAPFPGMVVEVKRQAGEWVEPGETVLRLIRIDRLRAEGFIKAEEADQRLVGKRVQLSVEGLAGKAFFGKIVFVSPEVDPVTRQARIHAEVDNKDLQLRPGQKATLTISPAR